MSFVPSDKNQVSRLAKRASLDEAVIYPILDEALVCTLAWQVEGQPYQLPTGFVRIENAVYLHGSVGSHALRTVSTGLPVCLSVTLIDALVLARSAFHHSVNYRSVIAFGKAELVTEDALRYEVLEKFTEKMAPGRWSQIRQPDAGEWRKTMVVKIALDDASAKTRTGDPVDEAEDHALDVWAGLAVMAKGIARYQPAADLRPGILPPAN